MRCPADIVMITCMCLMVLDERAATEKLAATPCSAQKLTAQTRRQLSATLISFDKSNGKHLGTWYPGFPDLQVAHNSSLLASEVQCSLVFVAGGLQEILEDQIKNLNPEDWALHLNLKKAVFTINTLSHCLHEVLGGECQPKPSSPQMPKAAFARKQWSHTLLEEAKTYLGWLQQKLKSQNNEYNDKDTLNHINATYVRYLKGSGYMV